MKSRSLILGILTLAIIAPALPVTAASAPVHLLELNGPIEPTIAQYIISGIERAEREGAAAVVIQMDTPGGLLPSTTDIVRTMLEARVPVIVYVSPRTAEEAVKKNVVDFIAMDMQDMLKKADGRTVKTKTGEITLAVKNAPIVERDMPWYKLLLHYLADPDGNRGGE